MSAAVQHRVWASAPEAVAGTALLVLLALADEANDAGAVETTTATIAAKARTSDRHVRRVLADLGAIDGILATHARGRIVAELTAFATPALAPASAPTSDKLSVADKMSGQIVRSGQNVRNSAPSAAAARRPPRVSAFSPPLFQVEPPTPTTNVTVPPSPPIAPATAGAAGAGKGTRTNLTPIVQAPPTARPDPWEPLYAAAALDLEAKATAWRSKAGPVLAHYGELAGAIGPHVGDSVEAAVEVWRAIVAAKKGETFGDGRTVWSAFSPRNAARLCRRHLQDNPGFASGASSVPPPGVDHRHVVRGRDGRWRLRPFGDLQAAGIIGPDAAYHDSATWPPDVRASLEVLRRENARSHLTRMAERSTIQRPVIP